MDSLHPLTPTAAILPEVPYIRSLVAVAEFAAQAPAQHNKILYNSS